MIYALLFILLLLASIQDIKERMVLDIIPLCGVSLAFSLHFFYGNDFEPYLYGVIIAFVSLFLIRLISKAIMKKEGIGMADVYMFSFIGACLGISALYTVLLVACISAFLFLQITKKKDIPFVPFLLIGSCAFLLQNKLGIVL